MKSHAGTYVVPVLLGVLPSLGNSFVSTTVGYLTRATGDDTLFFKVLLAVYVTGGVANIVQERVDEFYNAKFGFQVAYTFRTFACALTLCLLFMVLGEFLPRWCAPGGSETLLLVTVAAIGFCTGCLSTSGACIGTNIQVRNVIWVWLGVSSAGMLCVAVAYLLPFTPNATPAKVRAFFACGAALIGLCLLALCGLHCAGGLDEVYQAAAELDAQTADEGRPLATLTRPTGGTNWSPVLQGCNTLITVFLFPLLPLARCMFLAQKLVLWKLFMDFCGPLLLFFLPHDWSPLAMMGVLLVRMALLASATYLLLNFRGNVEMVSVWDALMLTGAMFSCAGDLHQSAPSCSPRAVHLRGRIRRNRLAHNLGIALGLLSAGAVVCLVPRRHRPTFFVSHLGAADCPDCVPPDANLAAPQGHPCGSAPADAATGGIVRIFHYGANMGCAKLSALGVTPLAAAAARIPGRCLRFAAAPGVPTTSKDPAYGTLEPCPDGCVHGVVHDVPASQLPKLTATEPGYALVEVPDVLGYDGKALSNITAYVMQGPLDVTPPSRRYAGLVYCQASASLASAYASQLACHLDTLGICNISCERETFKPLAVARFNLRS